MVRDDQREKGFFSRALRMIALYNAIVSILTSEERLTKKIAISIPIVSSTNQEPKRDTRTKAAVSFVEEKAWNHPPTLRSKEKAPS